MAIDLDKLARALQKEYSNTDLLANEKVNKKVVSTGNLAFNLMLDGGIPFGDFTEFVGFSQSGKSLFSQMILANAQKEYDAIGVFVDRENALTNKRAQELDIDTSKVIKAPATDTLLVTDAFEFFLKSINLIRKEDPDQHIVLVLDSIAAFDKDVSLEKSDSGRKQKATKDCLRKLLGYMDENIMCIIVNQFYYNVGQMFGDPRVAGGGEGLRYFNTIRIGLDDKKKIIDQNRDNEVVGSWIGIEVLKTRLGPCYRTGFAPFYYRGGIPYYGGYGRLLAHRNYLRPSNKAEFKAFKQSTLLYERDGEKQEVNEHRMENFLDKHPELIFDRWPDWCEE